MCVCVLLLLLLFVARNILLLKCWLYTRSATAEHMLFVFVVVGGGGVSSCLSGSE